MAEKPNQPHTGCHTGKQGLCPSAGNQAQVQKSVTGTNSSQQANEDHPTECDTYRAPPKCTTWKLPKKQLELIWPNMTANNPTNNRRDIMENKKLTETEIQRIKDTSWEEIWVTKKTVSQGNEQSNEENQKNESDHPNAKRSGKVEEIADNILRNRETVKETNINERPLIPKIKCDRHAKSALQTANRAGKQAWA